MKTVAVVWMGNNHDKSYMGIFEDALQAGYFLLEHGCTVKAEPRRSGWKAIFTVTTEFSDWVNENCGDEDVGWIDGRAALEGWNIHIDTVPFNTICRGHASNA